MELPSLPTGDAHGRWSFAFTRGTLHRIRRWATLVWKRGCWSFSLTGLGEQVIERGRSKSRAASPSKEGFHSLPERWITRKNLAHLLFLEATGWSRPRASRATGFHEATKAEWRSTIPRSSRKCQFC